MINSQDIDLSFLIPIISEELTVRHSDSRLVVVVVVVVVVGETEFVI